MSVGVAGGGGGAAATAGTVRATPAWRRRTARVLELGRRKPLGAVGAVVIVILILSAAAAPYISPYDPETISGRERLVGPSADHLLGTDQFGRDLLSRIIWGSRTSLLVGFIAVGIGVGLGSALGLVSGYGGGRVDMVLQRFVDAMMAFPLIIAALLLVAVLGPSIVNVMIAIGIGISARISRIVRGSVLSAKENDYVQAATAIGASGPRIMLRHILPNVTAPILVIATALFGGAILAEASLSFLGLGTPPPTPSWGGMVNESRPFLESAPWFVIFPGVALSIVVYAFNVLGDAVRDVMDPRLRGTEKRG